MTSSNDHGSHQHCGGCCPPTTSSMSQTLTELEFERGIWGAVLEDDLSRVRHLLDRGTQPSVRDSSGYTALHYAVRQSSPEIVQILLERGADPNAATPSGQSTPLHRAAAKGRPDIVKLLLRHGADALLPDADNQVALHHVCSSSSSKLLALFQTAQLLIETAPNSIDIANKNDQTAYQVIKNPGIEWDKIFKRI